MTARSVTFIICDDCGDEIGPFTGTDMVAARSKALELYGWFFSRVTQKDLCSDDRYDPKNGES